MKPFIRWNALAMAVVIWAGAASGEDRTTLTIQPDGSARLQMDKTERRAMAEQQARMWENFRKQNLGAEDDETKPPEKKEAKPLNDEELAKLIRSAFETQVEQQGQGEDAAKIETLEVKSNTVRVVTTQSFPNLEAMLRQSQMIWSQFGWAFENVKLEKDSDGRLRFTLLPQPNAQRYAKTLRQQWKMSGIQSEWRLVFPGKVLSSSWSNVQDNATWLAIDAQKSETLDAGMKLFEGPTVITAELAGLKLDQPLESKALIRSGRSPAESADVPITDGGAGFVAEAVAVTTTTLHYFPDGAKHLKEEGAYQVGQTGAVVRAKFFAPKERTLQSVSGVRVLKATDDKGRAILAAAAGEGSAAAMSTVYSTAMGARSGNSTLISLQLQLPLADAQSIDELSGEAIALTVGKWKEITLTNLTAGSTNEVDLGEILPGAKLSILKLTNKNQQLNLQARLVGPPDIRRIELQAKTTGRYTATASAHERAFSSRNDQSTRTLQLTHYTGNVGGGAPDLPTVVVRFPEDVRRERVRFTLKGLDLF